jgi:hypothetical protein
LGDAKEIFDALTTETEDRLHKVLSKANKNLAQGGAKQREALTGAFESARDNFKSGIAQARQSLGTNFDQAMSQVTSQYQSAEEGFRAAINEGRQIVERELQSGKEALGGFEAGKEAFRLQLTMSGAMGPEAQKSFYDAYQQSPATLFKLEQAAKLAASGGASGGTKLARLNELGLGIVSQDLDTYFNQLGTLAERSQRQGENLAQLSANFAPTFAGLAQTEAQGIGNIRTGLGDAQASLSSRRGLAEADIGLAEGEGLSRLDTEYGKSVGQSFENEGLGKSRNLAGAMPVLSNFQQDKMRGQLGFAGLGADIQSSLERELADIQAGGLLDRAGLKAQTVLSKADLEAGAMQEGVDAYHAGRIAGSGVSRGTLADVATGLGTAGGIRGLGTYVMGEK